MLANAQEWGWFSIFWRADDVTPDNVQGGGVLVNVFTPPLQEILYPRLCSTHPSSDPPPPGWLATGLLVIRRLILTYTGKYYGTLRLVKEGSHYNRISIQGACLIPLKLHKGIIQGTSATITQTNQSFLQSQT